MIKTKIVLQFIVVMLVCKMASAQKCNNWGVKPSFHCSPYPDAKWCVLNVLSKNNTKPDSVIWQINQTTYKTDTILLETGGEHVINGIIYSKKQQCKKHIKVKVPAYKIEASFLRSDSIICEGDVIKFTNTSGPGLAYSEWDFGDGRGPFTQTNPMYTFNHSNNYILNTDLRVIMLTVTDIFGCESRVVAPVSIHKNNLVGYIQATTDSVTQNKQLSYLPNLFENGILPTNYLWSTGDTTQHIKNAETGYYWLKVSDNNACWRLYRYYLEE